MNRLTREEAAKYLGCGISSLRRMEKEELFEPGDYYTVGRMRLYITERLDEWMKRGGEAGARERRYNSYNPLQRVR